MKNYKIAISGMHCASCATNVEKSLLKVSGVKSVNVSVMTKKGLIEAKEEIKEDDIKKAVSRAGYKVESIEAR